MTDYELQVFEKEHPEVIAEFLVLAEELLNSGASAKIVTEKICEMRESLRVIPKSCVMRLLHWHGLIYPLTIVKLTKEQIAMVRALKVDPRNLIADLLEWYRTEVYAGSDAEKAAQDGEGHTGLYLDARQYERSRHRKRMMSGKALGDEPVVRKVKKNGRPYKVRTTNEVMA